MKIYHNARCSKSREAVGILEKEGVKYEVVEYLKDVPSRSELKQLIGMLGIPAKELVRTGESIYIEHFEGKELDEDGWIDAMIEYPKLIQRPIVIRGDKAIIGRPPERVMELL